MQTHYVSVVIDVYCVWEDVPPRYRLFVNNELFTERTWIWKDSDIYLQEFIQIQAPPGSYQLRYELLDETGRARLETRNSRIQEGPGAIDNLRLEVHTC